MRPNWKRLISMILVVTMAINSISLTAFAETDLMQEESITQGNEGNLEENEELGTEDSTQDEEADIAPESSVDDKEEQLEQEESSLDEEKEVEEKETKVEEEVEVEDTSDEGEALMTLSTEELELYSVGSKTISLSSKLQADQPQTVQYKLQYKSETGNWTDVPNTTYQREGDTSYAKVQGSVTLQGDVSANTHDFGVWYDTFFLETKNEMYEDVFDQTAIKAEGYRVVVSSVNEVEIQKENDFYAGEKNKEYTTSSTSSTGGSVCVVYENQDIQIQSATTFRLEIEYPEGVFPNSELKYTFQADDKPVGKYTIYNKEQEAIASGVAEQTSTVVSIQEGSYLVFERDLTGAQVVTATLQSSGGLLPLSESAIEITLEEQKEAVARARFTSLITDFTVDKIWYDNQNLNNNRLTVEEFQTKYLGLEFKLDEGEWQFLTRENLHLLGISNMPVVNNTTVVFEQNLWRFTYEKLPGVSPDGEIITYRMAELEVDRYYSSEAIGDSGSQENRSSIINIELYDFEAKVQWFDNNNKEETRITTQDWKNRIRIYKATSLNDLQPVDVTSAYLANVEIEVDAADETLWNIKVKDLPLYDREGKSSIYYIVENEPLISANREDEYYNVVYKNTGDYSVKSNHLYDNGLVENTITGITEFDYKKVWLDGENQSVRAATNATFYLYRFAEDSGAGFSSASPVDGYDYNRVPLQPSQEGEKYLEMGSDPGVAQLPKYDARGRRYIYFLLESFRGTQGDYVTEIDNSGSPDNAYLESIYSESELKNIHSRYVLEGGQIVNRLKRNISLEASKKWNAVAMQSMSGASVVMQLERRASGGEYEVAKDDKGDNITATIDSFTPANQYGSVSFPSVPKYDENGYEYDYRYYEAKVTIQDENEQEVSVDLEYIQDGQEFVMRNVGPNGTTATFRVSREDGSIVNTLIGEIYLDIEKKWYNGESTNENNNITDDLDETAYAQVVIVNDDTGAYVKDENGNTVIFRLSHDNQWKISDYALPRYDETGKEIRYVVKEVGHDSGDGTRYGTHIDYEAGNITVDNDGEKDVVREQKAKVINRITGQSLRFVAEKTWVDGGDVLSRENVTFGVYRKSDPTKVVRTGVANAENKWKVEMYVSAQEVDGVQETVDDFFVREISIGSVSEMYGQVLYPLGEESTNTSASLESIYEGSAIVAGNVDTKQHRYNVYIEKQSANSYMFYNQRVGSIVPTITKTWVTGTSQYAPDAEFEIRQIQNDLEEEETKGKEVAVVSGIVLTKDNPTWTYTETLPQFDTQGRYYEYATYEVAMGGNKNFNNDGSIYVTNEDGTKDTYRVRSSYSEIGPKASGEVGTGEVPYESYFQWDFTNIRSETLAPFVINHVWRDDGNTTTNRQEGTNPLSIRRPDLSFTLYRTINYSAEQVLEGINEEGFLNQFTRIDTDFVWSTSDDWSWQASTQSMARYDGNGNEYTYFLVETLRGNVGNYETQYYNGTEQPTKGKSNTQETFDPESYLDQIHNALIVHGTGDWKYDASKPKTVVDVRVDTLTLDGRKVWNNLPADFDTSHLPKVEIGLYRDIVDPDNESNVAYEKKEVSSVELETVTSNRNTYNFTFKYETDLTTLLQRFDSYGRTFYYTMDEKTDLEAYDYELNKADFTFTNTYISDPGLNRVAITVQKEWDKSYAPKDLGTPEVSFELWRKMVNQDGTTVLSDTRVCERTLSAQETSLVFETDGEDNTVGNKLPYYAPNNYPYVYYVKEQIPDGYKVQVEEGIYTQGESDEFQTVVDAIEVSRENKDEIYKGLALVTNIYDEIALQEIQFTKTWEDLDDAFNTRPSDILLKLYRIENGEQVLVTSSASADFMGTEWKKQGNQWTFTFASTASVPLYKYSSDGEPYIYRIEEEKAFGDTDCKYLGYENLVESFYADGSYDGEDTKIAMHNALTTVNLNLRKEWVNDENYINQVRPKSITLFVEYSKDGGTNWLPLPTQDTHILQGSSWNKVLKVPKYFYEDGEEKEYTFRVREVAYTNTSGQEFPVEGEFVQENLATWNGKAGAYSSLVTTEKDENGNVIAKGENTLTVASLKFQKYWDDDLNRDSVRPTRIAITLWRDGEVFLENVYVSGEAWSYTFTNLPVYKSDNSGGKSYYEVKEVVPRSYQIDEAKSTQEPLELEENDVVEYVITNQHDIAMLTVEATKVWSDYNNQLNLRPLAVTFTLEYSFGDEGNWQPVPEGTTYETNRVVTQENPKTITSINWNEKLVWSVPCNIEGSRSPIKYRVMESNHASYESNEPETIQQGSTTTKVLKITNTLLETTLTVEKKWDFPETLYELLPQAVDVELQQSIDGITWEKVKVVEADYRLTADTKWTHTFERLSGFIDDANEIPIQYRAVEKAIIYADYEIRVETTNEITDETTGKLGYYTYTTATSGSQKNGYKSVITNALDTIKIKVQKKWEGDQKYIDQVRPKNVTLQVQATMDDGENWNSVIGLPEVVLDQDDIWEGEFEVPLYYYDDEKDELIEYRYRICEVSYSNDGTTNIPVTGTYNQDVWTGSVGAYEGQGEIVSVNEAGDIVATVTNKLPTKNLEFQKLWIDDNNRDKVRPNAISVKLMRDGTTFIEKVEVNGEEWSYVFEDLPLYQSDNSGKESEYQIIEYQVADYNMLEEESTQGTITLSMDDASATAKYVITNVHTPWEFTIVASKEWDDNEDTLELRPDEVTFSLEYYDEKEKEWFAVPEKSAENENRIFIIEGANTQKIYTQDDVATWRVYCNYEENEKAIVYRIAEDKHISYTNTSETIQVENTRDEKAETQNVVVKNTLNRMEVKVEKKWTTIDTMISDFPSEVEVELQQSVAGGAWERVNLDQVSATVLLTKENNWKHTFGELPQFDDKDNAKEIAYRVVEKTINYEQGNSVDVVMSTESEGKVGDFDLQTNTQIYTQENGVNGYQSTLSNTLKPGTLSIVKAWENESTYGDEVRPDSITMLVEYSIAEEGVWRELPGKSTYKLEEGNKWKDTISVQNLYYNRQTNKYEKIYYRVSEVSFEYDGQSYEVNGAFLEDQNSFVGEVASYDGSVTMEEVDGNFNAKAKNTLVTGSLSFEKEWDDDNNRDKVRPESLEITLYRDGEIFQIAEVNEAGNWKHTFENLPVYQNKNPRVKSEYEVKESLSGNSYQLNKEKSTNGTVKLLKDENAFVASYQIVNTHVLEELTIEATKEWDDLDNLWGIRPLVVRFTLQYLDEDTKQWRDVPTGPVEDQKRITILEGENEQTITNNNPKATWVVYCNYENFKNPIQYRVVEDQHASYEGTIETVQEGFTKAVGVVVKNILQRKEVKVKKVWDSLSTRITELPESIEVELQQKVGDTEWVRVSLLENNITLEASKNWEWSYGYLPRFADKENKNEITYRVVEKVLHYKDGWEVRVNTEDQLKGEVGAFDYTTILEQKEDLLSLSTITNDIEEIHLSMKKEWIGDDTHEKLVRPKQITVQVEYSLDGTSFELLPGTSEYTLSEENGWKTSIKIQKNYYDFETNKRKAIVYRVSEVSYSYETGTEIPVTGGNFEGTDWKGMVGAYQGTVTLLTDAIDGNKTATITNHLETQALPVTKIWEDDENRDGVRPTTLTVILERDGQNFSGDIVLTQGNEWKHTFQDLPVYQANGSGEKSVYEIKEVVPSGYQVSKTSGKITLVNDMQYEITNAHEIEVLTLEATKKWVDQENQGNTRPKSITFSLEYSLDQGTTWTKVPTGAITDEFRVTTQNDNPQILDDTTLKANWEVPCNLDGSVIYYRVTESKHESYESSTPQVVSSKKSETKQVAITNTLSYTKAKVQKIWNHLELFTNLRPESITVELQESKDNGTTWKKVEHIEGTISLSQENAWSYEVEILPRYADQENTKEIQYRFVEKSMHYGSVVIPVLSDNLLSGIAGDFDYEASPSGNGSDGFETSLNNTIKTIDLELEKIWAEDETYKDQVRPKSITVLVEQSKDDGTTWVDLPGTSAYVLSQDNGWKKSIKVQETYFDTRDAKRKECLYRVSEVSYSYETGTELVVTDGGFKEGGWSGTVGAYIGEASIRIIDDLGNKGAFLINQLETKNLSFTKLWDDDEDRELSRPDTIVIELWRDGMVFEDYITVTATDQWTHRFENLPVYKSNGSGEKSIYEIKEKLVPEYSAVETTGEVTLDQECDYSITNQRDVEMITIFADKIWVDQDNIGNTRPKDGVEFVLEYFDSNLEEWLMVPTIEDELEGRIGTPQENPQRILAQEDQAGWKVPCYFASFEDAIEYRVIEKGGVSYEGISSEPDLQETKTTTCYVEITNTLLAVNAKVEKQWDYKDSQKNLHPDKVEIALVQKIEGKPWELVSHIEAVILLDDENDWKYEVENLPKYADEENTKEIVYGFFETAIFYNDLRVELVANEELTGSIGNFTYEIRRVDSQEVAFDYVILNTIAEETIAVENTTLEDAFGTVMIESRSAISDGVIRKDQSLRYSNRQIIGTADEGAYIKMDQLAIGGIDSQEEDYLSNTSAILLNVGENGGPFAISMVVDDEENQIRGYVEVTKLTSQGRAAEIAVVIEELPISVDIGIPFEEEPPVEELPVEETKPIETNTPLTGDRAKATLYGLLALISLLLTGKMGEKLKKAKKKKN